VATGWQHNTRGAQVSERLAFVDAEHPHLKRENEEIAAWVEQGGAIRAGLVAAMHGEMDPRELNEGSIREWQAEGRNIVVRNSSVFKRRSSRDDKWEQRLCLCLESVQRSALAG
jgi:hypothetical protein